MTDLSVVVVAQCLDWLVFHEWTSNNDILAPTSAWSLSFSL